MLPFQTKPNSSQLTVIASTKQFRIFSTHNFEPELQLTHSYVDTFSPNYTFPCNLVHLPQLFTYDKAHEHSLITTS